MARTSKKASSVNRPNKRSGDAVTQLPKGKREEILLMNPDAVLLNEVLDPALVGAAKPMYVHQPDVWVAVYDATKVSDILWDALRKEEPEADEDDITEQCTEEFWRLWEFARGYKHRKHLLWSSRRWNDSLGGWEPLPAQGISRQPHRGLQPRGFGGFIRKTEKTDDQGRTQPYLPVCEVQRVEFPRMFTAAV